MGRKLVTILPFCFRYPQKTKEMIECSFFNRFSSVFEIENERSEDIFFPFSETNTQSQKRNCLWSCRGEMLMWTDQGMLLRAIPFDKKTCQIRHERRKLKNHKQPLRSSISFHFDVLFSAKSFNILWHRLEWNLRPQSSFFLRAIDRKWIRKAFEECYRVFHGVCFFPSRSKLFPVNKARLGWKDKTTDKKKIRLFFRYFSPV